MCGILEMVGGRYDTDDEPASQETRRNDRVSDDGGKEGVGGGDEGREDADGE